MCLANFIQIMSYEFVALISIILTGLFLALTKRWFFWPFSLRTLLWCGGFSYFALLLLPRIYVWQSVDSLVQILFVVGLAVLFSWILAYHKI